MQAAEEGNESQKQVVALQQALAERDKSMKALQEKLTIVEGLYAKEGTKNIRLHEAKRVNSETIASLEAEVERLNGVIKLNNSTAARLKLELASAEEAAETLRKSYAGDLAQVRTCVLCACMQRLVSCCSRTALYYLFIYLQLCVYLFAHACLSSLLHTSFPRNRRKTRWPA